MASVTIQKYTTAEACGRQVGHMWREHQNYSNQHVQLSKSETDNLQLCDATACRAAIHKFVEDIDARKPPKRMKKDRKTVAELCIPAPREETSREDAIKFFDAAIIELQEAGYHVAGGVMHADEQHEYLDTRDKQIHTSRLHLHLMVVPENEKGLNMKTWLTKSRYIEVNQLMDRVCEKELGYPYQDGSRQQSRGTVEKLKIESAKELDLQIAAKTQEHTDISNQVQVSRDELKSLRKASKKAKKTLDRTSLSQEQKQQELDDAIMRLNDSRIKAAEAAQMAHEEQEKLNAIQSKSKAAACELEAIRSDKEESQKELDEIENKLNLMSDTDIDDIDIKYKQSLTGTKVSMPKKVFERLMKTVKVWKAAYDREITRTNYLEEVIAKANEEARLIRKKALEEAEKIKNTATQEAREQSAKLQDQCNRLATQRDTIAKERDEILAATKDDLSEYPDFIEYTALYGGDKPVYNKLCQYVYALIEYRPQSGTQHDPRQPCRHIMNTIRDFLLAVPRQELPEFSRDLLYEHEEHSRHVQTVQNLEQEFSRDDDLER